MGVLKQIGIYNYVVTSLCSISYCVISYDSVVNGTYYSISDLAIIIKDQVASHDTFRECLSACSLCNILSESAIAPRSLKYLMSSSGKFHPFIV